MKKYLYDYISLRNVFSLFVAGVFLLMAIGSLQFTTNDLLPDGRIQETFADLALNKKRVMTGKKDDEGRWAGKVTIEYVSNYDSYTEETFMAYGMRQGISTRIYRDGHKEVNYYVNDVAISGEKKSKIPDVETSSYQLLDSRFPWFLFAMNACNFDSAYIESYMDTVETLLFADEFKAGEFTYRYGDVQDSLMNTHFTDIIDVNSNISAVEGSHKMKNSELRLAVLDRYRSNASSTFTVIKTTFPGYLKAMNDSGIVNEDFELFCHELDSCLNSYSVLNMEDAFFTDSIDDRLYRALYFIANGKKSAKIDLIPHLKSKTLTLAPNRVMEMYGAFIREYEPENSTAEISQVVINDILIRFYTQADIFKEVFYLATLGKKNYVVPPEMATAIVDSTSETGITVRGYVLSDGGSNITSEGIVWATHYNPTIDDSKLTEAGLQKDFEMNLSGLTRGATYYIRSFALNSKGLSYGNCVDFVAGESVSVSAVKIADDDLIVYPNPVQAQANIKFKSSNSKTFTVDVYQLNGKLIWQKRIDLTQQGVSQFSFDFSGLKNGFYYLILSDGNQRFVKNFEKVH